MPSNDSAGLRPDSANRVDEFVEIIETVAVNAQRRDLRRERGRARASQLDAEPQLRQRSGVVARAEVARELARHSRLELALLDPQLRRELRVRRRAPPR